MHCMYKWFTHSFFPNTTAEIVSSQLCDTTTLLAIWRKTLPIPMDWSPGFLSNGINLHAINSSLMTIDLQMFYINRLSCYQADLISRSSSSYLHQDQSVLCSITFFKLSTSIEWNLIRWISSGISGSKVPGPGALPCGYFCFIWYKNCFICI